MNLRQRKVTLAAAGVLTALAIGGGAAIAASASASASAAPASPSASNEPGPDGEHADGPEGGRDSQEQDSAIAGSIPAPAETEQADRQETGPGDARRTRR
jgi:hypothetical protein